MAYTVRALEDAAMWMVVTNRFRVTLAGVTIDGQPPAAHFSFWRTDGSQRLIAFEIPVDISRRQLEKHIVEALASSGVSATPAS